MNLNFIHSSTRAIRAKNREYLPCDSFAAATLRNLTYGPRPMVRFRLRQKSLLLTLKQNDSTHITHLLAEPPSCSLRRHIAPRKLPQNKMGELQVALGASVPPHTAHAISVSLPKWRDNVGYEEGEKRVVDSMVSGYPRFFIHLSIRKVSCCDGGSFS